MAKGDGVAADGSPERRVQLLIEHLMLDKILYRPIGTLSLASLSSSCFLISLQHDRSEAATSRNLVSSRPRSRVARKAPAYLAE